MTVTNSTLYGSVKHKSAYANLQLYNLEGKKANLVKAIGLFLESLSIRTIQDYPLDYGITKSNLALAYHKWALLQDFDYNTKMSISAFDEALSIFTLESYPMQYGALCNNLGNVYMDIAKLQYQYHNNSKLAVQNWLLAIEKFSESVYAFKESHPEILANILITRGALYQNIAMMDIQVRENSLLALNDFNESLRIYTLEKYPYKYSQVKYNIGVTYMKLYDKEISEEVRQNSISSFKEAANLFDKSSEEYHDTLFNLGNIYMPLEKKDYTVSDCKTAIDYYKKSLEWHKDKPITFHSAMTWYSIGLIYSKLMHLEDKVANHGKMLEAFANSLLVITKENNYGLYKSIHDIMRNNRLD